MNAFAAFAVFAIATNPRKDFVAGTTREDGTVGLPGGKVDPNEDVKVALLREAAEEGWELNNISEFPVYKTVIDNKLIVWFSADIVSVLIDHKEVKRGILPVMVRKNSLTNFGNREALKVI